MLGERDYLFSEMITIHQRLQLVKMQTYLKGEKLNWECRRWSSLILKNILGKRFLPQGQQSDTDMPVIQGSTQQRCSVVLVNRHERCRSWRHGIGLHGIYDSGGQTMYAGHFKKTLKAHYVKWPRRSLSYKRDARPSERTQPWKLTEESSMPRVDSREQP